MVNNIDVLVNKAIYTETISSKLFNSFLSFITFGRIKAFEIEKTTKFTRAGPIPDSEKNIGYIHPYNQDGLPKSRLVVRKSK